MEQIFFYLKDIGLFIFVLSSFLSMHRGNYPASNGFKEKSEKIMRCGSYFGVSHLSFDFRHKLFIEYRYGYTISMVVKIFHIIGNISFMLYYFSVCSLLISLIEVF